MTKITCQSLQPESAKSRGGKDVLVGAAPVKENFKISNNFSVCINKKITYPHNQFMNVEKEPPEGPS